LLPRHSVGMAVNLIADYINVSDMDCLPLTRGSVVRKRSLSLVTPEADVVSEAHTGSQQSVKKITKRTYAQKLASTLPGGVQQPSKRTRRRGLSQGSPNISMVNPPETCLFCAVIALPGDAIQCDTCTHFYHIHCSSPDTSSDTYEDVFKLVSLMGWNCKACRSSATPNQDKLKQTIADLSNELKASYPYH